MHYRPWLLTGLGYLLFVEATGCSLPCPVHWLTGWQCPGCGVTRMMLALAQGDLSAAWRSNPAILLASPFLLLLMLQAERKDSTEPRWASVLGIGLILWFLGFGIWRNL